MPGPRCFQPYPISHFQFHSRAQTPPKHSIHLCGVLVPSQMVHTQTSGRSPPRALPLLAICLRVFCVRPEADLRLRCWCGVVWGGVVSLQGGAITREHASSAGYYDGRYWAMWKLPMFGCTNASQVLEEIQACKMEYPNSYIRIIGFDGVRQVQVVSFIVGKPIDPSRARATNVRQLESAYRSAPTRASTPSYSSSSYSSYSSSASSYSSRVCPTPSPALAKCLCL